MSTTALDFVFRPGRIGGLELPHRIIMGPMHLGFESEPAGEALAAFYAERARGGAALIITGGSAVDRVGAGGRHYSFINEPGDWPKLRHAARTVHASGGLIALQLFHAGRYASDEHFGLQPLAPSAVPSRFSRASPRAMTDDDIARCIEDFARGARRARILGFDAVQIMGSEGYLLNQFLSPLTNRRDDAWGGDFARRARFPRAVLHAVRAAVGPDLPVIYRMSGADLMPGSTRDEETLEFARLLAEDGVDALDVGVGWHESSVPTVQYTVTPGAWVRYAEAIKRAAAPVPVIASTRVATMELADRILSRGEADFVSLARPFLADPEIVAKSRAGRIDAVNPCIACNQACIDRSLRDLPVSCMVNPRAGRELALREAPSRRRSGSFAVIGGGPAGLETARVLAALGHRVHLYESESRLGGQFRLASRIPGKEDFARTIAYLERELDRLGVEIHLQARIDAARVQELDRYDGIVVATGVVPRRVDLPGAELAHVRSYPQAVLEPEAAAGPVVIIGAGGIGVDIAHLYSHAGSRVALLCRGATIGARIGRSTRWVLMRALRGQGVEAITGAVCQRIVPAGVWILEASGAPRLLEARTVVIAVGQESADALSPALERRGLLHHVVGGARTAAELDAVRAFHEGAVAAHALGRQLDASRAAGG